MNRGSIQKVADLLRGSRSSNLPIDLYLRQLVNRKQLAAFVTVPFLSTTSESGAESEIRGTEDISRQVAMTYRRGYFKDADYAKLIDAMNLLIAGANVSPLETIYIKGVQFALSDRHVTF